MPRRKSKSVLASIAGVASRVPGVRQLANLAHSSPLVRQGIAGADGGALLNAAIDEIRGEPRARTRKPGKGGLRGTDEYPLPPRANPRTGAGFSAAMATVNSRSRPLRKETGASVSEYEAFRRGDEEGLDAVAAHYWDQALNPTDAPPSEPVGYPDGLGASTNTTATTFSTPTLVATQLSFGIRYAGFAIGPTIGTTGSGSCYELTAVDSSGNITWALNTNADNPTLAAIRAQAAALRGVTCSIGLENASAEQVMGGYGLAGVVRINGNSVNTLPATIQAVLSAADVFERIDISQQRPGKVFRLPWYPSGPAGKQMIVPTTSTFTLIGESMLVYIVRLPNLATGVTPGDWEVFNWVFTRVVQWEPAVGGVLLGGAAVPSDDALQQLPTVVDFVRKKTGVELGNLFVPGAGKWADDAWQSARRLVRNLASHWSTATRLASVAGGVARAAGLLDTSPKAMLMHYQALIEGRPSLLADCVLAKRAGDPRYHQGMVSEAVERFGRIDTPEAEFSLAKTALHRHALLRYRRAGVSSSDTEPERAAGPTPEGPRAPRLDEQWVSCPPAATKW